MCRQDDTEQQVRSLLSHAEGDVASARMVNIDWRAERLPETPFERRGIAGHDEGARIGLISFRIATGLQM
jgi:hypothetical protein